MSKYIWMKVTEDKYEFPLEIADTVDQLAALVGVTHSTIVKCIRLVERGVSPRSRYVRVAMEEG